ncbi:hypothetical protein CL657_02170 [bacterium]|nr:hypothetical protein [bacterium]
MVVNLTGITSYIVKIVFYLQIFFLSVIFHAMKKLLLILCILINSTYADIQLRSNLLGVFLGLPNVGIEILDKSNTYSLEVSYWQIADYGVASMLKIIDMESSRYGILARKYFGLSDEAIRFYSGIGYGLISESAFFSLIENRSSTIEARIGADLAVIEHFNFGFSLGYLYIFDGLISDTLTFGANCKYKF